MNKIDTFLNRMTMYRSVLYGLILITAVALLLSGTGVLAYQLTSLLGSLVTLLASGMVFHYLLRSVFKSGTGVESEIITSLILFLILKPADDLAGYAVLVLGAAIAMSSKYVLAIANRHIFNPAAIALVILGVLGSGEVYWWVGSDIMLPAVLMVGLLVVRKVRRFTTVGVFMVAALTTFAISSDIGLQPMELLKNTILSGPLIFFAAIMLTEPATSPSQKYQLTVYGILVGILYGSQFSFGPIYSSPEVALVAGNLYAYVVGPKRRYLLTLVRSSPLGGGVFEFTFTPDHPIRFKPGQYLEWTLSHHRPDSRGDRRYFTIASAPEEHELKLCVRIEPAHSSSFKRSLLSLQQGETVWASQLGGEFVMPHDASKQLVFIAGGIGITPFRSMVQHIINTGQQRDITLFYSSPTADGFSYWQLFNQAEQNGIKPNYVITGQDIPAGWRGITGHLSMQTIQEKTPHYKKAIYYISGPNAMVTSYKKMLVAAGIPRRHIRTDYFPGF